MQTTAQITTLSSTTVSQAWAFTRSATSAPRPRRAGARERPAGLVAGVAAAGQVGQQRPQVTHGLRRVGRLQPRVKLVDLQPALAERGVQPLGDLLPVGVAGPQ